MNRYHAHRTSRIREAIDVVAFFAAIVVIVFVLSLDGIR